MLIIAFAVALAVDVALLVMVVNRGGIDSVSAYFLMYLAGVCLAPILGELMQLDVTVPESLAIGAIGIGPFFCFAWRFNLWRALREQR